MNAVLLYRQANLTASNTPEIPERSLDQLAALCRNNGFTGISPKAADGVDWQAAFDSHGPLHIDGLSTLEAQRAAYAAHNLTYEPWVVPRGRDPLAEAELHAHIARACGTLVVDYEHGYAGFWDSSDANGFYRYSAALRALSQGARLVLCFDPRQTARREYDFGGLFWNYDAFSSMSYWTDFQQAYEDVLAMEASANVLDRDRCPMLPGNAQPGDFLLALTVVRALWKAPTVYVFQRVGFRAENGAILRSLRD
jgi:hypothetical protein